MAKSAKFYILGDEKEQLAGTVTLDGGKIKTKAEPGFEEFIQNLAETPIFFKDKHVDPKKDPQTWLDGLPAQYRGSWLVATTGEK